MSEAEVKTATGDLDAITERNGWTEFAVDVGGQYPLKLSTKLQPVIELARAVGKVPAVWTYSESQGNPNPNKPGSFYMNRYLTSVEPAGESSPAASANDKEVTTDLRAPPKADVDWDSKERRDYRSRAWAQTLGAFTHTIKVDEKPEDVFMRLQPFQRKVFTDVCQSFAFPGDDEDVPF